MTREQRRQLIDKMESGYITPPEVAEALSLPKREVLQWIDPERVALARDHWVSFIVTAALHGGILHEPESFSRSDRHAPRA